MYLLMLLSLSLSLSLCVFVRCVQRSRVWIAAVSSSFPRPLFFRRLAAFSFSRRPTLSPRCPLRWRPRMCSLLSSLPSPFFTCAFFCQNPSPVRMTITEEFYRSRCSLKYLVSVTYRLSPAFLPPDALPFPLSISLSRNSFACVKRS